MDNIKSVHVTQTLDLIAVGEDGHPIPPLCVNLLDLYERQVLNPQNATMDGATVMCDRVDFTYAVKNDRS